MYGHTNGPLDAAVGGAKQDGLKYWPDFKLLRGSQVSMGIRVSEFPPYSV